MDFGVKKKKIVLVETFAQSYESVRHVAGMALTLQPLPLLEDQLPFLQLLK